MKEEKKVIYNNLIKNLIIIFVIAIIALSSIFTKTYTDLDEIWNFNFG